MRHIAFTAKVLEGDYPAANEGLQGIYYICAFEDWDINSSGNFFDYNDSLRGKPKTIVLLKDGVISSHHFDNQIGVELGLKEVSEEEKQQLVKTYKEWKAKAIINPKGNVK